MWSDYAYGRNAVYPEGHHGNAVLSRFPIEHYENRDVSVGESEKRGLLYCRITPPELDVPVHVAAFTSDCVKPTAGAAADAGGLDQCAAGRRTRGGRRGF